MTPFEWFNVITESKKTEESLDDWNTFMINRIVSMGKSSVFVADHMNKNSGLSSQQVFDFYIHVLPKGRVYNKYAKTNKLDEDIELIQQTYKVSKSEAIQYLELLSDEDIKNLKDLLFTGGSDKKPKKEKETKNV
jgi:hypothetical protein